MSDGEQAGGDFAAYVDRMMALRDKPDEDKTREELLEALAVMRRRADRFKYHWATGRYESARDRATANAMSERSARLSRALGPFAELWEAASRSDGDSWEGSIPVSALREAFEAHSGTGETKRDNEAIMRKLVRAINREHLDNHADSLGTCRQGVCDALFDARQVTPERVEQVEFHASEIEAKVMAEIDAKGPG
jgi:hypothetical protein